MKRDPSRIGPSNPLSATSHSTSTIMDRGDGGRESDSVTEKEWIAQAQGLESEAIARIAEVRHLALAKVAFEIPRKDESRKCKYSVNP